MKLSTEFKTLIWANGCIAVFLAWMLSDLISLLIPPPSKFNITQQESEAINYTVDLQSNTSIPDRPLLIPKIIHQTYKTVDVPDKWIKEQQSCINFHPDYKYILWTDKSSRDFIAENYNWFLPTFDSYPYNIMRADVIRYFVLYHYGGVYIDLDDGCSRPLDPLLALPSWFRKTDPTGISNDIMGSIPKHEFMLKIIDNLQKYNRNWLVSYITIMFSTGPLFVSVMWKQYLRTNVAPGNEIRLLLPENSHSHKTMFFYEVPGSSWHNGDAKLIMLMNNHKVLAVIGCFMLAFFIFFVEYKIIQLGLRVLLSLKFRTRISRLAMNPAFFFRSLYSFLFGSRKSHYTFLNPELKRSRDKNNVFVSEEEDSDIDLLYDDDSDDSYYKDYDEKYLVGSKHYPVYALISSLPGVSSIVQWLEKNHQNKRRERPVSVLLPSYRKQSRSSTPVESDISDASYIESRVLVNSNVAATPILFVDDIRPGSPYQKTTTNSELSSPHKQLVNISTISLSSTGNVTNDDTFSTHSLSPVPSRTGDITNDLNTITGNISTDDNGLLLPPPSSVYSLRPTVSRSSVSSVGTNGSVSPIPSPRIGPFAPHAHGSNNTHSRNSHQLEYSSVEISDSDHESITSSSSSNDDDSYKHQEV